MYTCKMVAKRKLSVYRRRVKSSKCRGKRARTCGRTKKCKYAIGKKRSFCRKRRNARTHTMRLR